MKTTSEIKEDVFKCTRCGNCQYYCPSYTVNRLETHVARGRLQLIKRNLDTGANISETYTKRLNQCLLCGNCSQNCPAGLSIEEIIEEMRELCVRETGPSRNMSMTAGNINSAGNITGDERKNRLLWLENMDEGSVRIGERAKYVYFTGCVPSLYPSSYSIPQSFSKLLNKAGLDWAALGERENCCAYPLTIGGMAEEAAEVMKQNVREITAAGAEFLVTTCPSCYHMWSSVYPKVIPDMPDIKILHGTQLLAELTKKGAFKFKEMNAAVTYHDPCDLGRKSGIYNEPREILKAIPGLSFVEMKFSRENAFCCGGGGNLEMNDSALSGEVAQQRVKHAQDTGAEVIVTACQQCKRTLAGGARQMRARIKIMDLSELMLNAIE